MEPGVTVVDLLVELELGVSSCIQVKLGRCGRRASAGELGVPLSVKRVQMEAPLDIVVV